ncbi:pitrilysin family protein [Piscinibacter sp. XHJ-5]|uniref:M16 family metallopeptidase n=1 Tax=Piscinibacter sp. XHJ-5 TaxID=3037797 RepID=UPI002452DBB8|nr:pitrilysin family protein [Piscinibacter sp. XHJ-5]
MGWDIQETARDADAIVARLGNGVRVVTLRLPYLDSVSVSVFVRTGSRNESRRLNGISHFVEHMAFKGTHERSCQQINLDAERLGAEVNAHTDKDHTAFHMHGMARDAGRFLRMLGDVVQNSTFPEAELEREREVILQEYAEDEDDPLSSAYKLFDKTCFGAHAMGRPVIGTRANIERFTRVELLAYVQRQYSGENVVIGVAGNVDPHAVAKDAEAAFGRMVQGIENVVQAPPYLGGIAMRRQPGCSQTHVVLGFPTPTLRDDYHASVVAAALFGEGMSSPLLDELRERRGLVYYAACSADVSDLCGQFVIEASTAPENVAEFSVEVARLLDTHAESTDPVGLARARNQIAVRRLRDAERPYRRLEQAAQDLFVHGRVRSQAELAAHVDAVTPARVREAFARMLAAGATVAVAGKVPKGADEAFRVLPAREPA